MKSRLCLQKIVSEKRMKHLTQRDSPAKDVVEGTDNTSTDASNVGSISELERTALVRDVITGILHEKPRKR